MRRVWGKKIYSEPNLCKIERNVDIEIPVRKYENVLGRSCGMQMEIVEVRMNGDELMDHLIHCATLAMSHDWNVTWNAQARTVCVNTSPASALHFSAVLDHDVQDKLNTAIPCSNQCIFLATHSPRTVRKKILDALRRMTYSSCLPRSTPSNQKLLKLKRNVR